MSRQEIENVEKEWQEAFNAGDAAGVAKLYAPNGRILPPNGPVVEGRAAIKEFGDTFLAMQAKLSFSPSIAVYEGGDIQVAVGTYEMDLKPDGTTVVHDSGKYIEVLQRQKDGSLQIVEDIFNSNVPLPT